MMCMAGGICPGGLKRSSHANLANHIETHNSQLLISPMFLKRGHFPFPNESDVSSIHKCPSSGFFYKICVPKGDCGCYVTERRTTAEPIIKVYCNQSCLCLFQHQGRYCSQCIQGYYKEGTRCYQYPIGAKRDIEYGTLLGITAGSILMSTGILYTSTEIFKLSVAFAFAEKEYQSVTS